jgi:hypothetical protein
MREKSNDQYSEREAARRRDETARVLLKTPPRPNWWPTKVRKIKKKRNAKASRSP